MTQYDVIEQTLQFLKAPSKCEKQYDQLNLCYYSFINRHDITIIKYYPSIKILEFDIDTFFIFKDRYKLNIDFFEFALNLQKSILSSFNLDIKIMPMKKN